MDKIRELMLRIESESPADVACQKGDEDSRHLLLLKDEGFIQSHAGEKSFPVKYFGDGERWCDLRLTWKGSKFLDDVRKDTK